LSSFLENLRQAMFESMYSLSIEKRSEDPQYQKTQQEYMRLFNEIQNKLGKHRKLMLRLEEHRNEMACFSEDYIYLQGFIDCVSLLKLIKLL
jgi:hypothetical protein